MINKNNQAYNKTIASAIDKDGYDLLDYVCIQENITKSELIRKLVYQYIEYNGASEGVRL